jgi:hypothetical protein
MLDATVTSLKEAYAGAYALVQPIRKGRHIGRELLLMDGESLNMSVRIFFENGIGYHVMVSTSPDYPLDSRDIERFLDSFELR